jgi:hypothetical protein
MRKRLILRQAQDERETINTFRHTLVLSLSKDERLTAGTTAKLGVSTYGLSRVLRELVKSRRRRAAMVI